MMSDNARTRNTAAIAAEFCIAGTALVALVVAQLMLSAAIHGTNFDGGDGKMAQATIRAALNFGGIFQFNNISPIQGLGSQLLPLNVWANPTYWSFAFLDGELATDIGAAAALGIFAAAGYIMARCFDVPVVPSVVAAQLCIVLFAPVLFLFDLSTVFSIMPGNAVVYAPHMVALGLLARLEPGSWKVFGLMTAGIFVLLVYSLSCDPLWSTVSGFGWAVPFVVVSFGSLRLKTILVRCAALGCCAALSIISRMAEYMYVLPRYTARVQFFAVVDRPRGPDLLASALFYSSYMKYFYFVCALGWLFGIMTLRGRARLLVIVASLTCCILLAYCLAYLLLLNVAWRAPLPSYLEQGLIALFIIAAVAGFWGALRSAVLPARRLLATAIEHVGHSMSHRGRTKYALARVWRFCRIDSMQALIMPRWGAAVVILIVVAIIPAAAVRFAVKDAPATAERFHERWPNEPEFGQFFSDNIGWALGRRFRGSVHVGPAEYGTVYGTVLSVTALWTRGVPTVFEYSQLTSPQSLYFLHAVLKNKVLGALNGFAPSPGLSKEVFWSALQLFGARYFIAGHDRPPWVEAAGFPWFALPYRPLFGENGVWYVYELPHPNVGDYSPTELVTAMSGAEIAAVLGQPRFDFRRQVVVSTAIGESLVSARDMRFWPIRGGIHVSGHSEGTSLVVLPQQFSHCLRAQDARVRLTRVDLMMTGMIFSGDIDTDIMFDFGLFTPTCRWADLADMKRLDLNIDLRQPHLSGDQIFPDWSGFVTKLRSAAAALK
jgi:hypothetical protein